MKNKNFIKFLVTLIMIILGVIILCYYSFEYIKYNQLIFTVEDKFILFFVSLIFFIILSITFYLNLKMNKILKLVKIIEDELVDMEDNLIETSDTKMNVIFDLLNEVLRGHSNEKKSIIKKSEKMDGEK